MLVSTRQSSPWLSRGAYLGIAVAALAVCLLPTFQRAVVQAQDPTAAKPAGRIYVSASYRVKPDEDKKIYNAIIAIDPLTGKWQLVVENGHNMRLSPDRQTLVFSRFDKHTWKIDGTWKCERDGQFPLKISNRAGRPIWSPDGKHLVATKQEGLDKNNDKSRATPTWKCETWLIDEDGRNPVKLPIPETSWVADWSADGQWFVVGTDRHPPYGHGYQLYLMKTDGSQERRLTHGGLNVYARFSPDGKKVLYLHQTRAEGNSIWTVDIDGENATEIVREEGLSSPDGAFWSPDGKQIAVVLFDWELDEKGEKVRTAGNDPHLRIEVMDADGTNRRRIPIEGAQLRFIGSLGDWR
ncbi:MAG TPA: DPP IV N-terminal domain-containing protein [Pirellulales bacterium]